MQSVSFLYCRWCPWCYVDIYKNFPQSSLCHKTYLVVIFWLLRQLCQWWLHFGHRFLYSYMYGLDSINVSLIMRSIWQNSWMTNWVKWMKAVHVLTYKNNTLYFETVSPPSVMVTMSQVKIQSLQEISKKYYILITMRKSSWQ